jgi:ribose transport system substrate-binding protein
LLALAVALAASVALAACGSSSSSSSSTGGGSGTGESGKEPSEVKLSMITASTTQNVFQEISDGAKAAGEVTGAQVTEQAPNGIDPAAEVALFQAATHTSSEGIAYMTTAPDVFAHPTAEAAGEGIPLVAVDASPLPGSEVETFVGNDNIALGESVAEQLITQIPKDASGEIVMGNDIPGLPLLEARITGMENVIKKERPKVKVSSVFNVGAEPAENYDHWNALVKAHPDALAYMEPGDQGAVSFKQITAQTGQHYLVGGCDVDPTALEAVKEGSVFVLGDPHHWLKGYIATTLLAEQAISGKPLPIGWWNSGSGLVTKENVDEIIAREESTATRLAFFEKEAEEQLANPPVTKLTGEALAAAGNG